MVHVHVKAYGYCKVVINIKLRLLMTLVKPTMEKLLHSPTAPTYMYAAITVSIAEVTTFLEIINPTISFIQVTVRIRPLC